METSKVHALVIFGATGDLAKLETFPALVGLVDRGVLDAPIVGVANSGWGLERFRGYAVASLRHNGIDPDGDPAQRMLDLLDYVDGDLTGDAVYETLARILPRTGAIRDVVQNHLLQVLASVLADPPCGQGFNSWLDATTRVIEALRPLTPATVVRAQ